MSKNTSCKIKFNWMSQRLRRFHQ